MRSFKFMFMSAVAIILSLVIALIALPVVVSAATVLPNGFTAKVVATSGQKISGTVDATGFDVGIYIGPGVHDVTVTGATVSGANDEGILVQDTSYIVIKDSTVKDNAINPADGLTEVKAIVLAGTTNCLVMNNTVENNGHGGISLLDDGSSIIFAPTAIGATPVAGTNNVIKSNLVKDDEGDCGIVVAAKNPGGEVSDNVISKNSIVGGIGGIVIAGGAFGPVNVVDNNILNNEILGGFIPGISLHAFGPGVISGTHLIGNVLSNNGTGELSGDTTGIEIFAIPGVGTITGTQVLSDAVSGDNYGIWHAGDTATHIAHLTTSGVAIPVFPVP